jgi:hypothetical protein
MKRKETEGFQRTSSDRRLREREREERPLVNDFRKRVTFAYPVDESRELIANANSESIAGKIRSIR